MYKYLREKSTYIYGSGLLFIIYKIVFHILYINRYHLECTRRTAFEYKRRIAYLECNVANLCKIINEGNITDPTLSVEQWASIDKRAHYYE